MSGGTVIRDKTVSLTSNDLCPFATTFSFLDVEGDCLSEDETGINRVKRADRQLGMYVSSTFVQSGRKDWNMRDSLLACLHLQSTLTI